MKKISKVSLTMLVLALGIFVAAGTGNACTDDVTGVVYGCGATIPAGHSCTFNADMHCAAPGHGLIIGGSGVAINGNGYMLDGGGIAGRNCKVLIDPIGDQGWCVSHPCRCANIDNDPANVCDGCIDSGILNANPANPGTCQGGFDNATVRNLEITGWCDGIFMSGDCYDAAGAPAERRLTGILIEGNKIRDNGRDCGSFVACPQGADLPTGHPDYPNRKCDAEEGYWTLPGDYTGSYFNDAIYLAQVGIDAAAGVGQVPNCEECVVGGVESPDLVCPDGLDPTTGNCPELCVAQNPERNIVRHNKIFNQRGCGKISCPGGNGVNLNGGLEESAPFWWTGCNEIAKNLVSRCAMSGIQYQHALMYSRIHGNYCTENGFGGITNPCGWCDKQYIYGNVCKRNQGAGIAVNAVAYVKNNICVESDAVDSTLQDFDEWYGIATKGVGIACGDGDSELMENTCVRNRQADIVVRVGAHGDLNLCGSTINYTDNTRENWRPGDPGDPPVFHPCTNKCWGCQPFFSLCSADIDLNCMVNVQDFNILRGQWFNPNCCPSCP